MLISAFLVEDRSDVRRTLVEALEEMAPVKFVGLADSEKDATQWLKSHPDAWDLALVDLFLGQGSGFGVLQACRTRKPGQKVVVLTSYPMGSLYQRCKELGADEVFDKSQEVEKLVAFCQAHAKALAAGNSSPP